MIEQSGNENEVLIKPLAHISKIRIISGGDDYQASVALEISKNEDGTIDIKEFIRNDKDFKYRLRGELAVEVMLTSENGKENDSSFMVAHHKGNIYGLEIQKS